MSGHKHAYHRGGCVEIDEHVCLRPFVRSLAPKGVVRNTPESDAYGVELAGFIVSHDRPGFDDRCEGAVTVKRGDGEDGPVWDMSGTLDGGDLTLSPSVLCVLGSVNNADNMTECGFHGWIRGGRWVPA